MRRGPGRWSASRSRVSRREAGARSGRAACEPPGSADRVHRPDDCASPPTSPVTEGGQMAGAAPDAPARLGGGRDHHPGGVTVVSDPAPAPRQAPDAFAFAGKLKRTEVRRSLLSVPGREIVQVLTEIPVGVESGWHTHPGEEGVHRRRDGGDARRGPTAAHAARRGGVPHPAGDTPQCPGPGPGDGADAVHVSRRGRPAARHAPPLRLVLGISWWPVWFVRGRALRPAGLEPGRSRWNARRTPVWCAERSPPSRHGTAAG